MNKLLLNLTLAGALAAGTAQATVLVSFDMDQGATDVITANSNGFITNSMANGSTTATVSRAFDLVTPLAATDAAYSGSPAIYGGYYGSFVSEAGLNRNAYVALFANGTEAAPDMLRITSVASGTATGVTASNIFNFITLWQAPSSGLFDSNSTLEFTAYRQSNVSLHRRWAVVADGTLYVSAATTETYGNSNNISTIANSSPDSELWYSWAPGADLSVPNLTSGVAGSTLSNITHVGIYGNHTALNNQQINITTFDATLTAVPEPSTYAALLGALALGMVAWRRRRG